MMDLEVLRALRVVLDPELGIDVVSLGLVYEASREVVRLVGDLTDDFALRSAASWGNLAAIVLFIASTVAAAASSGLTGRRPSPAAAASPPSSSDPAR